MNGGGARLCSLALALACAGTSDAIARGQRYYEDNQYERALAIWRDLERRDVSFAPGERVRYAYLRGMTDYRLGYREDARHWLAVAKSNRERAPDSLVPSWNDRLDAALVDLERGAAPSTSGDVVQTIAAPNADSEPTTSTHEPQLTNGRPDAGAPAAPASAAPGQP
jgi:hypothetical protein